MKRRDAIKSITLSTGAVVSYSSLMGLLQSCQSKPGLTWIPQFLSDEEAHLITKTVDMIIPKGDSVGALELKVPSFIDAVGMEVYGTDQQKDFKQSLNVVLQKFDNRFNHLFSAANSNDQEIFIRELFNVPPEKVAGMDELIILNEIAPIGQEKEFYLAKYLFTVRDLTIFAFFNSEEVGKNMLKYMPIPGKWNSCIPYNGIDPVLSPGY